MVVLTLTLEDNVSVVQLSLVCVFVAAASVEFILFIYVHALVMFYSAVDSIRSGRINK